MIKFSSRMNLLKGSAIRELLALANKPEVLSFAGGMPAPELFPVDKIKAATDAVLEEQGRVALQYSSTNGFEHFRQQIADRMEAKLNIKTSADNILVTSGSQQGLDYSARVFCDKGDVIIIESPSYLGALNAFKACEPNFVAIPTDGDGMIMEELEKVLADIQKANEAFTLQSLAIDGRDVMTLGIPHGPEVGKALSRALDAVIDEKVPNEKGALLDYLSE